MGMIVKELFIEKRIYRILDQGVKGLFVYILYK